MAASSQAPYPREQTLSFSFPVRLSHDEFPSCSRSRLSADTGIFPDLWNISMAELIQHKHYKSTHQDHWHVWNSQLSKNVNYLLTDLFSGCHDHKQTRHCYFFSLTPFVEIAYELEVAGKWRRIKVSVRDFKNLKQHTKAERLSQSEHFYFWLSIELFTMDEPEVGFQSCGLGKCYYLSRSPWLQLKRIQMLKRRSESL